MPLAAGIKAKSPGPGILMKEYLLSVAHQDP